jgi:hypothetical protein
MTHRLGLVAGLLIVVAAGSAVAQPAPSLQGAWRVTEVTVTGANAASNKSPQPGIFVFTKGHYSIVTVGSTAPRKNVAAAANPGRLTDAEKIARFEAFDQFIANTGTYEVKGTTLTTHPIVAKNPATMGTTTTREFRIEGNTLVLLQTSPAAQPASQTTTRLTRIE